MKRFESGHHLKRGIDLVLAVFALCLLSPLLIVLGTMIWLRLGPPIFFRQCRSGRNGRRFVLAKFRTMRHVVGPDGKPFPDEQRLTRLGQFLRATSLDELPSLWNVLRGDISLVGPRPLLMEYLDRYTPEQSRRHEVKPGITGWAQVNGRNAISWEKKFELDVWYVDHQSFWLDLKILWMTVFKVVRRSDIHADDHVTMPEFRGGSEQYGKAA